MLLDFQTWARAERIRETILKMLTSKELRSGQIRNSAVIRKGLLFAFWIENFQALHKLLKLYESSKMNVDWLLLDWKTLSQWGCDLPLLFRVLDFSKTSSFSQTKTSIMEAVETETFWQNCPMKGNHCKLSSHQENHVRVEPIFGKPEK